MKRLSAILSGAVLVCAMHAQPVVLTLDSCRSMALNSTIKSRIDRENVQAAKYASQAVTARFFPQVSANGVYLWNSRHAYVLPQIMDTRFGSIGLDGLTFNNSYIDAAGQYLPRTTEWINEMTGAMYGDLYNRFDIDMTHVLVGQVGVVQPVYVGGRIIFAQKMARSLERIAQINAHKNQTDVTVETEEAYWRVLSVEEKKRLAERYLSLVKQLEEDVLAAQEEGMATNADVLQVKMALGDAESSLAQARNGLTLSRMALCQIIGLPLETDISLGDSARLDSMSLTDLSVDMLQIKSHREELQLLGELSNVARSGVGLAAAGLQPNIVASANYVITNPSVADGFNKSFEGFFSAGVAVNIPIAHASDILAVRAAKHKAKAMELQLEEARQKIELQATQSAQKVNEARYRLAYSKTALAHSEEILRYAQDSYAEGMLTATDLMKAQTAWHKAYTEKIDAAIALRMAEITYKKHTGQL
ncbi:MAG: TolC family protein [Paludibacteraceae bacterium]|nr:TolC family protein [Paludibacteraceae bacterium]